MTFGYVRNNGLKIKEGNSYIEPSNFINICDTKKTQPNKPYSQLEKVYNAGDKEKMMNTMDRIDKPLIERVAEKKDKNKQQITAKIMPNTY